MSRARLPILSAVPFFSRSLLVAYSRKGPNEAIFPRKADGPTAGASSSSWVRGERATAETLGVARSSFSRFRPGSHVSTCRVTETCLDPDKGPGKSSFLEALLILGRQLRTQRRPAGVRPTESRTLPSWRHGRQVRRLLRTSVLRLSRAKTASPLERRPK